MSFVDDATRNAILVEQLPYIRKIVTLSRPARGTYEDVLQRVLLYVLTGLRRYDPARATVPTYVAHLTRVGCQRVRRTRATRHDDIDDLEEVVPDVDAICPETSTIQRDFARKVWARLEPRERSFVKELVDDEGNMAETARRRGVSRERVRQQRQAIAERWS